MAKYIKIGKYEVRISEKNITCTCMFGSLYPLNYKNGEKVCKHIQEAIKNEKK